MKIILAILTVFEFLWDLFGFLLLPAIFVGVGLLDNAPWQYYAITVGGYFALFALLELIFSIIFKKIDKKYSPVIERKIGKAIDFIHEKFCR